MADIAGTGALGVETNRASGSERATPEVNARLEEERRQAIGLATDNNLGGQVQDTSESDNERQAVAVQTLSQTDTDQESDLRNTRREEIQEDTITLSAQAQLILDGREAREDVVDAAVAAVPGDATGGTDTAATAATATITADADTPAANITRAAGEITATADDEPRTNQDARDEDSTFEVSGNLDSEIQQARVLGQVVDRFA